TVAMYLAKTITMATAPIVMRDWTPRKIGMTTAVIMKVTVLILVKANIQVVKVNIQVVKVNILVVKVNKKVLATNVAMYILVKKITMVIAENVKL
ncbi:MAG: hypothetical protein QF674_03800, partial [Candidatus Marinimicrobia bacterium]|nr:hypothetical protein [Candidatus Neomarinimicrobiota bacterium]MDP7120824.1 hypothetical protein [Candidatus Neomarinimicrobiota bacterium]MDP7715830.1 hypothetical protein [Candidatus Neomarinimicrobiota bacterium]